MTKGVSRGYPAPPVAIMAVAEIESMHFESRDILIVRRANPARPFSTIFPQHR